MNTEYLTFDETGRIVTSCDKSATHVVIPEGVTKIGKDAFWGCSALTSIEIPNSVTEIGLSAFFCCSALKSIIVAKDSEHFKSVDNVLFSKDGKRLIAFSAGSERNEYSIPEGVTEIGSGAFRGCSALTSIEIPNSVTKIGDWVFDGCSALASIEIPNSVTVIGEGAFHNCSSLTSIKVPNSVTKIGWSAFWKCSSLKELHVRWEHPEDIDFGNNVFERINPDCILYVPIGTGYAYRHHEAFEGKFREVRTER